MNLRISALLLCASFGLRAQGFELRHNAMLRALEAPDTVPADAPTPVVQQTWYGWQTLIVDAASVSAYGLGIHLKSGAFAVPGISGYVFGAPLVHRLTPGGSSGWLSFALRVALPVALAGIAGAIAHPRCANPWECGENEAAAGAVAGAAIAIIVDGLCSWKDEPSVR